MSRRIFSVILALCLLAGLSPPGAWATSAAPTDGDSTIIGDNLRWLFNANTGTLTISLQSGVSGNGVMTDFSQTSPPPWYDYRKDITSIVMESGVTTIGAYAFAECETATSVTIPDSVTSIGDYAFFDCSGLSNVTIPDSVISIGEYTFSYCIGLTSVTIPDSVTSIGSMAFADCSSLTSVTISNSVTYIDSGMFIGCGALTSVTIPDGVTSIGGWAFERCSALMSVTIPDSVTSIDNGAFVIGGTLSDVYYGGTQAQWSTLQSNIGSGNDPLLNATIHCTDGDITAQSGTMTECHVFFEANGGSGEMEPVTVTPDSYGALEYVLPQCAFTPPENSRFYAWQCTMYDAQSSERVMQANPGDGIDLQGVVSLGLTALWEKDGNFVTITFDASGGSGTMDPVTVEAGTAYAFPQCAFTPPDGAVFGYWLYNNCGWYPGSSVTFEADATIETRWIRYEDTYVNRVVWYADDETTILDEKTYPDGESEPVTDVTPTRASDNEYDYVFAGWQEMSGGGGSSSAPYGYGGFADANGGGVVTEQRTLTRSVKSYRPVFTAVPKQDPNILASGYCGGEGNGTNLSWVLTNDGVLTISGSGRMADYDYNGETEIVSSPWFSLQSNVQTVVMESGVGNVGRYAFAQCSNLRNVTIPNSVTSIDTDAFWGCVSLLDVTIPDSVTAIGGAAFNYCNSLTSVNIPASVVEIGGSAFTVCKSLTEITVDSGNSAYSSENGVLFNKDRTSLICYPTAKVGTAYVIPESVSELGEYAFEYSALASVTIPKSVVDIQRRAFVDCDNLTDVYYSGTRTQWNAVTIESEGNEPLLNATIHFMDDETLDPYRVLESLHDMDTFEDQTWHLAGPLSEFRTLTIDDTVLTQGADYAAADGSTKLDIPAGTFARFGEGTHSVAAEFQTFPDPNVYEDDGRRTAAEYYTVRPSGKVTIDASEINAAKAVKDVSYTARFRTNPRLNDDYYRFVVTDGEIPAGLTFHDGGYFTGVIANSAAASYPFTVGLQIRKSAEDPWPDDYSDTVQVTIAVEEDTTANVETSSDPGYELVERISATIEESGGTVHLASKGPFEEFQDFYIDGVRQIRGVDYQVMPCLIDADTGEMIRLLDSGAITGTYLSLNASKLSIGAHSLNLEFVKTDPIGNKQTRNASQKVTVTQRTTPVVTPVSGGGGGGGGGSSAPSTYAVTASRASNGKITLSATKVAAGKTVTITLTPNSGYQIGGVSVTDSKKNSVSVSRNGNQYAFTMPKRAVTVSATFTPSSYGVSANSAQHGKITLDKSSATSGATVNGSTTPDKGYLLSAVTVRDADGKSVKVETFDNGKFTFLMPSGKATVSATFTVKRLGSFVDIQGPDWFFDDAEWAYNRGIIQGTTPQYWEPQSLMSSITSIVTLERLDGVDLTPYDTGADDGLDNSAWYVAALRWANANNITLADRPFGGQNALTRGEFAVMLSNYLRYRGLNVAAPDDLTFTDAASMTPDELNAFLILQEADVFRGYSDGSIRPNAYLSRAHLSALLHRLSAYIIQAESGNA